jgi:hypothetical protein
MRNLLLYVTVIVAAVFVLIILFLVRPLVKLISLAKWEFASF